MANSYMPTKKVDQVLWAGTFVAVVGPKVAEYGLTADLFSPFQTLNATLQTTWRASENELTRTKVVVDQRDSLLKQMKQTAGKLVSIIQGTPTVTSDMLIAAGLTVRKTTRTPTPVPESAPLLVVKAVNDRTVTLELRQDKNKRGRPAKVASASVFTAPAGASLSDNTAWTLYTSTTKTTVDVAFPPGNTGETVQITAFWSNSLSESGPVAKPQVINLPASGNLPGNVIGQRRAA